MPRLPSLVVEPEVRDYADQWALRARLHGQRLAGVQRALALCGSRGWASARQLPGALPPLAERPAFNVLLALIVALSVALFFTGSQPGVPLILARTVSTSLGIALTWTYLPSLEGRLFHTTLRQFEVLYLMGSACAYAGFSIWSQAERLESDSVRLAESACTFSAVVWSAFCATQVDSIILSLNERKRLSVGVLSALFALNGVRILLRERLSDDVYSPSRVCVFYCARLRTLALSALSSYTFFMLKITFYALRDSRSRATPLMVTLRCPMYRSVTREQQQLSCVLPRVLVAKVFPRVLRSRVSLEGDQAVVMFSALPRVPLVRAPVVARWRKSPAYYILTAVALLAALVASAAEWTLQPAVAFLSTAPVVVLVALELCCLDVLMLGGVFRAFETWFLLLNATLFFTTSTLARLGNGRDNEASVCARLGSGVAAFLWVLTFDASNVTPRIKALGCLFALVSSWTLEFLDPQFAAPGVVVCSVFCASYSEVARGALLTLSIFFAKNTASLLWDGRLVIMRLAPGLPRPESAPVRRDEEEGSALGYQSSISSRPFASSSSVVELAEPARASSPASSSSATSTPLLPPRLSLQAHRDSLSEAPPDLRGALSSESTASRASAAGDAVDVALLAPAAEGGAGGARSNSRQRLSLLSKDRVHSEQRE